MSGTDKVGARVRTYRERLGITTEELGKNAGLETSLIESIESGEVYPAIGVMVRVSRALGQRLGTFMDDQRVDDPVIVRRDEREEETSSHKGGAQGHYHYYPLGKGKSDRHMEPLFIRIEEDDDRELSSHEGEEFVIVVSGEVELLYGNGTYRLGPGDSMYYNSLVPHRLGAADGPAEIYAIIFTPF